MSVVDFINVRISCDEHFREILIAELDALGYDSMLETDEGLEAYIEKEKFEEQDVKELVYRYQSSTTISYDLEEVVPKNWNEEWEKNYDPIVVDDQCLVRATFHKIDKSYPYEIIINPRMSFGTGHHATTYLMLKAEMELPFKGKRVLDAGCGTAILAIMASKLGAGEIIAYDIDSWSTDNAPENVALNGCENITTLEGTIDTLNLQGQFDVILANINKNVLLDEIPSYEKHLAPQGYLLLSGFYESDEPDMIKKVEEHDLSLIKKTCFSNWSCLLLQKK